MSAQWRHKSSTLEAHSSFSERRETPSRTAKLRELSSEGEGGNIRPKGSGASGRQNEEHTPSYLGPLWPGQVQPAQYLQYHPEMKDSTTVEDQHNNLPGRPAAHVAPPFSKSQPGNLRLARSQSGMQPTRPVLFGKPTQNCPWRRNNSDVAKHSSTATSRQLESHADAWPEDEAALQASIPGPSPGLRLAEDVAASKSVCWKRDRIQASLAKQPSSGRPTRELDSLSSKEGGVHDRAQEEPDMMPPSPTKLYLVQACLPVLRSAAPRKLLVILDLNGTLVTRPDRAQPSKFIPRPGVHQLLDYLFQNHAVMVYSSAQTKNVRLMIDALVGKDRVPSMTAIWGREKLGLSPSQYNTKIQVYKKLENVWADSEIQATSPQGHQWTQDNTVLVDDSAAKASAQPHNLIQVPEFSKQTMTAAERRSEHDSVTSIQARLEALKWTQDVSRLIREWQVGRTPLPRNTRLGPLPRPHQPVGGGRIDGTQEQDDHNEAEQCAGRSAEITSGDSTNHTDPPTLAKEEAASASFNENMEKLSIGLPKKKGRRSGRRRKRGGNTSVQGRDEGKKD